MCSFWLCGSIVANPTIYRLVPSPSRFKTRQCSLDDAKDCTQSGWSKQQDCCSFSLLFSRNPVRGCWSLLENYLAVSTWIFNGSSIECQEKKHQPFSLSGVRYGSQAIQISTGKFAWHWSGRKWAIHPWLLVLITCSNSQRKAHIIVQIRHFEPQKFCNE